MTILEQIENHPWTGGRFPIVFTLTAPGNTPRMGRITYRSKRKAWAAVQDYIEAVGEVPTIYATRTREGDIEW